MTSPDVQIASPALGVGGAVPSAASRERRAIFHPVVDFLCLGGASLLVMPFMLLVPEQSVPSVLLFTLLLANILNHPHFAVSYQIFYRGFRDKAFGDTLSRTLRARYIVAGLVVPAILAVFFAYAFARGDARVLGWGGNLMLLLVGWHYVKQGYGMLIVDSVYQRRFFSDTEKAVFRYNAYACWVSVWLFANWYIAERKMWGLAYYSVHVPTWALQSSFAATLFTTILTLGIFSRRLRPGGGGLPVTGVMAYLTTLYFWFAARYEPAALLLVPGFHSLQYLLIVGRYEFNRTQAQTAPGATGRQSVAWRLGCFTTLAVMLGILGFWLAPMVLDTVVPYDKTALGGTAFLFTFWIFINVHHYFIDNVIWRRDNPDTGAHLFGAKPAAA